MAELAIFTSQYMKDLQPLIDGKTNRKYFYTKHRTTTVPRLFKDLGKLNVLIRPASAGKGWDRACRYHAILTNIRVVKDDPQLRDSQRRRTWVAKNFDKRNDLNDVARATAYFELSNIQKIVSIPQHALIRESSTTRNEHLSANFPRARLVVCRLPEGVKIIPVGLGPLGPDEANEELNVSDPIDDARVPVNREIRTRRGQTAFRNAIRHLAGDRCMITGCTVVDLLQAAHIRPYRGQPQDNDPQNGLLLRSDIHDLYDLDLLTIDASTGIIRIDSDLKGSEYERFDGRSVNCDWTQRRQQFAADRKEVLGIKDNPSADSDPSSTA